jgi:hypothetical protein
MYHRNGRRIQRNARKKFDAFSKQFLGVKNSRDMTTSHVCNRAYCLTENLGKPVGNLIHF